MSKFSCAFFFGNPTNKSVTRTAYTWEQYIANHLDQSIWSTNQNNWVAVRSNLLHSFLEVHNCVAPFTSHGNLHEFGAEKPISWPKMAHFDFFTINFTVRSHILSIGGDARSARFHTPSHVLHHCVLHIMLYPCWDCRCAKYIYWSNQ
jgi:hypothetical protein